MNFFKKLFGAKEQSIQSYADFWAWFQQYAAAFHQVVKEKNDIDNNFFKKLEPKLKQLKDGFWYLTGMIADDTAELVLTAEGVIENFVFVEELVSAAPPIAGWKFTALKPALDDIENFSIRMNGLEFNKNNMSFYDMTEPEFPDEIEIVIVHHDQNDQNKNIINNGVFIFLDNYLGELFLATVVDNIRILSKEQADKELIPLSKLKDYLIWRQKEFVEKHHAVRPPNPNDTYSIMESTLENGNPLLATVNTDLLKCEHTASYPWSAVFKIPYQANHNGMPGGAVYTLLAQIEDEIRKELKDEDGYLYVGRQYADGMMSIYFACKDFRRPSKLAHVLHQKYGKQAHVQCETTRDKYWYAFKHFMQP